MDNLHKNETFPGFPPEPTTNYWQYPRALNGWWYTLTPNEQKLLDYILRHTWGYKKIADAISLNQFLHGIKTRDEKIIDRGTGIKNVKTVRKALKGLVSKHFIERIERQGKQPIFKLKIDPSQDIPPLPNSGTPVLPNNGTGTPSQTLVHTIKDNSIEDTNSYSAPPEKQKRTYKEEIPHLVGYLSMRLGMKFPYFGKQARYTKLMLDAGYSTDDICWAIDTMLSNPWWQEHSFDMKNVADEIPKLMTRIVKTGGKS